MNTGYLVKTTECRRGCRGYLILLLTLLLRVKVVPVLFFLLVSVVLFPLLLGRLLFRAGSSALASLCLRKLLSKLRTRKPSLQRLYLCALASGSSAFLLLLVAVLLLELQRMSDLLLLLLLLLLWNAKGAEGTPIQRTTRSCRGWTAGSDLQ